MRRRDRIRLKRKRRWQRRYAKLAKRYGFGAAYTWREVEYDPTQEPDDAWWLEVSYMDWD